MTELELKQLLSKITRPDETARTAAHAHWASLAKPLGGLGRLETMLEDAAALTGTAELAFSRRAVLVLCADNGVVAQGVSQTDQSVTRAVAENLAARRTSVCQMAKTARCEVVPVDMGMAGDSVPGVVNCRIAAGTQDFTQGPAMTRAEAIDAIAAGIALVRAQKAQGVQLLATDDILYLETRDRLLHYHTTTGTWSVRGSLLKAEKDLTAYHFARCNQCYLVNLAYVKGIESDFALVKDDRLEISRRQRTAFLTAVASYMGGVL